MNRIPKLETSPIELQRLHQLDQLKPLLNYLYQRAPFYRRQFKACGLEPGDIETLESLSALPLTGKQDLQAFNKDFFCVPPSGIAEFTCTSGTQGTPVTVPLTPGDLRRLAYNEYLSFGLMELTEEDIVQLMLTLDRQFMAGMAYYSGLQKLGAAVIRTGPGGVSLQWQSVRQYGVTAAVAVPSFLLKLKNEIGPAELGRSRLRKILAIGESLRDENLNPGPLLKAIQEGWDVKVYNTYASTEMQTAFTECAAGRGGHHHPELLIVELLDEDNRPVEAGQPGEVTVTTLGVEGMPLLRFKTGDICKGYYEPCSCGRTTMRLGPVLARKQQLIKLKGTTIYPIACLQVLQAVPELNDYYIRISHDELGRDKLEFLVHTSRPAENILPEIRQRCIEQLRVQPEIHLVSQQQIQELLSTGNPRKPQRIGDFRIKRNL